MNQGTEADGSVREHRMNSGMDVIVIGAGLSGLCCARELTARGLVCQVLEASDDIGGRVRTDKVDGFLLDRGFQVFLTAYPAAQAILDYGKLGLQRFEPGALVRYKGRLHRFADPWRRPQHLLATAFAPIATLADKFRIAGFRKHTTRGGLEDIYRHPETTTLELLRERGFSEAIIERFFRPFLGGVFLDDQLHTSSRMCEFVFRMFALGDATLPENGMGEIPRQLASQLPSGVVKTGSPVEALDGHEVILKTGEKLAARAVVIATEAPTTRRLLHDLYPADGQSVRCLYFAAHEPPVSEPILVLNGEGEGPINNLCVPSQVAPNYAPSDQSLISVTALGEESNLDRLVQEVRSQLESWFGSAAAQWRHLRTYDIPYALPSQAPPALQPVAKSERVRGGVFVCGDHCDTASINGAMAAGQRAAEAVLSDFEKEPAGST